MLMQVRNVEKIYGRDENAAKALDRVSFTMNKGEFVSIMGASGSGKTTLLNCISTIDKVSSGEIILNQKNIAELHNKELALFRRDNLGFIFQNYNLLDTLTLEENIALPLTLKSINPGKIRERVIEISRKLQIDDILARFPSQVSGGQRQRAACARAVITEPKILLADEPTGALDSASAHTFLKLLEQLNVGLDISILMVTHDPISASFSRRILFLRDGKIFQELNKNNRSHEVFHHEILEVLASLGGDRIC